MQTLKRYFTRAELDFLMDELISMSHDGIGPVESGVPLTGFHSADRIELMTAKKALGEMKVGDSRVISNKLRLRPILKAASATKTQVVTKRLDRGEYRIWKISEPGTGVFAKKVAKKSQKKVS